jgi:threonine dehydratase
MAAGEIVSVDPGSTIADGLKPTRIGESNFAICKERVAASAIVSDKDVGQTLVRLLLWGKTLVEPSGAAALAAALESSRTGGQVGVILSGGNIAPEALRGLLSTYAKGL